MQMNSANEVNVINRYLDNYEVCKLHFSKREKECISHLINGLSSKQIAKELNISHRTVEFYLESIKNKFKCRTRLELICKFIKLSTRFTHIFESFEV